MKKTLLLLTVLSSLTACTDSTTGQTCLGKDQNSFVEKIAAQCKAGDAIATQDPVKYCDFSYSVSAVNTAVMCIYSGEKIERTTGK